MAVIDYGAVLFKNGVQQNHEMFMDEPDCIKLDDSYFVYAGDGHFMVTAYKYRLYVFLDGELVMSDWAPHGAKSSWYDVDGVEIHIKYLANTVCWARFSYKGDHYNIMYGYGIDADREIWEDIKVRYLGKKLSKCVDKLYARIERGNHA